MLVQIYEIGNPQEGASLARLGVDHIGVLIGPGEFPREVSIVQAQAIFAALPPATKRVALSLSGDSAQVARVVAQTRPDIVHIGAAPELFGPAQTRALKAQFPQVAIMRAIPVVDQASIALAKSYETIADFLLLDSYDPADRQVGALGRTHDWRISRQIVAAVKIPVILAGGLGPDNVQAAIAAVRPAGVDSKTKTDAAGSHAKDPAKVEAFLRAAKTAA